MFDLHQTPGPDLSDRTAGSVGADHLGKAASSVAVRADTCVAVSDANRSQSRRRWHGLAAAVPRE
jgi:hypothetical protein